MTDTPDQNLQTIDAIVVQGFTKSRDVLFSIFRTEDPFVVSYMPKTAAAMRMMSDEMVDQIAVPIIKGILDAVRVTPGENPETWERAGKFDENIALGLQDATSIVLGQQQQRMQNQAALAAGRPQKLIKS